MLKDMLKDKGISIYAAAKGSGIPYTTLSELVNGKKKIDDCSIKTIAALAGYFNMSIDSLLSRLKNDNVGAVINQTWEKKKNHTFIFPIIAGSDAYDSSRIHPLKQRSIKKLHEKLAEDSRIESLILFGSSVNIRCGKNSDIDIAIGLSAGHNNDAEKNEISETIGNLLEWKADIIWEDRIEKGSKLEKNISMGVKII